MGLGLGSGPVFDIREAFKKKTIFFVTNVTLWGGGVGADPCHKKKP